MKRIVVVYWNNGKEFQSKKMSLEEALVVKQNLKKLNIYGYLLGVSDDDENQLSF